MSEQVGPEGKVSSSQRSDGEVSRSDRDANHERRPGFPAGRMFVYDPHKPPSVVQVCTRCSPFTEVSVPTPVTRISVTPSVADRPLNLGHGKIQADKDPPGEGGRAA